MAKYKRIQQRDREIKRYIYKPTVYFERFLFVSVPVMNSGLATEKDGRSVIRTLTCLLKGATGIKVRRTLLQLVLKVKQ